MKKYIIDFKVVENLPIHKLYSLLKLTPADGSQLPPSLPGQFVQVQCPDSPSTFLRRPISINHIDREANQLWLLVRKAGAGTEALCAAAEGSVLNMIYPLGSEFKAPENKDAKILLVGGGVGIAPMVRFGLELKAKGYKPETLVGARSAADILERDLLSLIGPVHISTDDGSEGHHGLAPANPAMAQPWDYIYCCGPKPMMVAVAKIARERGICCEVSLENMMACGVGACLCCVEKTVKGNVCVCTEGPVFNINSLTW